MNKIVVNLGNVKLDEISLHRGSLNIGRAADNDISLADAATSAHHAKIVTIFTSSFIQDLNSTNGTIVNGRKVVRHTLHHGDIISIGNMQLLFKSDTSEEDDGKRTISIDKDAINTLKHKPQDTARNSVQGNTIVRQKQNLSGFSISAPATNPTTSNMQGLAEAIPVLDESMPLGELRNNPDNMVVLEPKSKKTTMSVKKKIPENMNTPVIPANDHDDTTMMPEITLPNMLDDEHIRDILVNGQTHTRVPRKLAGYSAIFSLLVIIAISIYLVA